MFTGIVTDLGQVRAVERGGDARLTIATGYDTATIAIGASIACAGVCLTVIDKGSDWFAVQVSAATLSCTTLGEWRVGRKVNLERSLRVGDELGGHIVSGHVDDVGEVVAAQAEGQSLRCLVEVGPSVIPYVAPKGAVTVDGVSLTVNEVIDKRFGVNVIPHTRKATSLGELRAGDKVNIEADILARYVARLARTQHS
jgi:riboflavin synthase